MEKNPARQLYDYWLTTLNFQMTEEQRRTRYQRWLDGYNSHGLELSADFNDRSVWPRWRHSLQSRMHVWIAGYMGDQPIFAAGETPRRYNSTAFAYMVLWPNGTFYLPSTYTLPLRRLSGHTFLGYQRVNGDDVLWVSPQHNTHDWLNHREWGNPRKYFRANKFGGSIAAPLQLNLEDDRWTIRIAQSLTKVPGTTERWDQNQLDLEGQKLQAEYDWVEKRYRFYHRRHCRNKGLPDPYMKSSPRREAALASIIQMVQPYTPAKSHLLKPLPVQQDLFQAQEG